MIKVNVKLTEDQFELVKYFCKRNGDCSRASIMRLALQSYSDTEAINTLLSNEKDFTGKDLLLGKTKDLLDR